MLPFEQADRIPTIEGTLDGMPVRLSVDTGSRSSLTLNSPFVKEHDLINRYHAAPESISGWGAGGPSRAGGAHRHARPRRPRGEGRRRRTSLVLADQIPLHAPSR